MAQIAVHVSLSSEGYEPLVCAHALFALWAALREGAGRPATDYRPVWVIDGTVV
jgi:hypothetical protein